MKELHINIRLPLTAPIAERDNGPLSGGGLVGTANDSPGGMASALPDRITLTLDFAKEAVPAVEGVGGKGGSDVGHDEENMGFWMTEEEKKVMEYFLGELPPGIFTHEELAIMRFRRPFTDKESILFARRLAQFTGRTFNGREFKTHRTGNIRKYEIRMVED